MTIDLTSDRELVVERAIGSVKWQVNEFDGGHNYMLVAATGGGASFSAHFDADQWAAFQALIGGESDVLGALRVLEAALR